MTDAVKTWEDGDNGKIVRIHYGDDGYIALADAAYVNSLEAKVALLAEAKEMLANNARTRHSKMLHGTAGGLTMEFETCMYPPCAEARALLARIESLTP